MHGPYSTEAGDCPRTGGVIVVAADPARSSVFGYARTVLNGGRGLSTNRWPSVRWSESNMAASTWKTATGRPRVSAGPRVSTRVGAVVRVEYGRIDLEDRYGKTAGFRWAPGIYSRPDTPGRPRHVSQEFGHTSVGADTTRAPGTGPVAGYPWPPEACLPRIRSHFGRRRHHAGAGYRPGGRQVVQGRKRRAVGQSRRSFHDAGFTGWGNDRRSSGSTGSETACRRAVSAQFSRRRVHRLGQR